MAASRGPAQRSRVHVAPAILASSGAADTHRPVSPNPQCATADASRREPACMPTCRVACTPLRLLQRRAPHSSHRSRADPPCAWPTSRGESSRHAASRRTEPEWTRTSVSGRQWQDDHGRVSRPNCRSDEHGSAVRGLAAETQDSRGDRDFRTGWPARLRRGHAPDETVSLMRALQPSQAKCGPRRTQRQPVIAASPRRLSSPREGQSLVAASGDRPWSLQSHRLTGRHSSFLAPSLVLIRLVAVAHLPG